MDEISEEPPGALLIEDNPGDARLFREILGESDYEVSLRWEEDLSAGLDALEEEAPDVVVADLGLPDSEGPETVKRLVEAAPELPIVVLTGQQTMKMALASLEAGATEYLRKDELLPALVARTLRTAVERKRIEAELRRSRERYRSLFRDSSDAILVHDLEGRVKEANPKAEALFGVGAEELRGRTITSLFAVGEEDTARKKLESLEKGEPYRAVSRYERADGSEFWGELSADATEIGGETVVRTMIRDVTEQKRRERELRERDRQLQQIRENVTEVVWMSTPEKEEMEFISEAYEDVTGRPAEELDSQPLAFLDAVHSEDRERVRTSLKAQQERPKAYEETYRIVQPDGEIRWVHDKASGVYNENGELERIIGVATDITEQKRREQALQKRQEKMEALYEATTRLLRAETKEEVSASILNLVNEVFGYPIVAVRYVEDGRLVPVEVSPEIPEHMPERPSFGVEGESVVAEVFREGKTAVFDDLRTFDDPFDYGEVRATAIVPIGEHGSISVADLEVGTIDDYDRHLIEILSTAAALVLDRIKREQKMVEAREEAEKASQLKSAMLANMSHEVRTPLTSITGFAEILTEELEGRLRDFASRIYKSGQRLMGTLDSVLQLSKLEAGAIELDREPLSLTRRAKETTEMLRLRADEKSIALETNAAEGPIEGEWNEEAIRRILEKLVENAIKFTPEGGRVEVRVWEEEEEAVLEVKDTGVGISGEALPEVFEAFKQESEGLGREYEGSGLGLSIVKRLVEAHGGSVEVETQKEEGTCFTVRLPLAPRDE